MINELDGVDELEGGGPYSQSPEHEPNDVLIGREKNSHITSAQFYRCEDTLRELLKTIRSAECAQSNFSVI